MELFELKDRMLNLFLCVIQQHLQQKSFSIVSINLRGKPNSLQNVGKAWEVQFEARGKTHAHTDPSPTKNDSDSWCYSLEVHGRPNVRMKSVDALLKNVSNEKRGIRLFRV